MAVCFAMANCPNCNKKLHLWNIKAECPKCGISIPNFNWEHQLELDNIACEKAFNKFHTSNSKFKYCYIGTKLRIFRLVFSLLPLVGFVLPWAVFTSETGGKIWNLITVIQEIISLFGGGLNSLVMNMQFENYLGAVTFGAMSLLFFVLHVVFIVLAFFMILFTFKKFKTPAVFICDVLSIVCAVISIVLYSNFAAMLETTKAFVFGSVSVLNGTAAVSVGVTGALLILIASAVMNFLVMQAPAKSDEELEVDRIRAKEIKEAQAKEKEQIKKSKKQEKVIA